MSLSKELRSKNSTTFCTTRARASEPCCVEPLCDELDEEVCDPEDGIVGLGEGMLTEGELGD